LTQAKHRRTQGGEIREREAWHTREEEEERKKEEMAV